MYETEIYHFSNNSWTFEAKSFLPRERGDNPSIHFDDTVLLVRPHICDRDILYFVCSLCVVWK